MVHLAEESLHCIKIHKNKEKYIKIDAKNNIYNINKKCAHQLRKSFLLQGVLRQK